DKEADYRPDGLVVNSFEGAGSFQHWKCLSGGYRAPCDGPTIGISENAWDLARSDDAVQCLLLHLARWFVKLGAWHSPPHTPAVAVGSTFAKQCFEILPACGGYWLKLEVGK